MICYITSYTITMNARIYLQTASTKSCLLPPLEPPARETTTTKSADSTTISMCGSNSEYVLC